MFFCSVEKVKRDYLALYVTSGCYCPDFYSTTEISSEAKRYNHVVVA
jgi:hypothetical protein